MDQCAQRLSASWIVSQLARDGCSTPVGVMDRFTTTVNTAEVCSTPVGVMDRFTTGSFLFVSRVLNACRRHGSFHESDPPKTFWRVLNACRRHGSFHNDRVRMLSTGEMCSTPVGVMDRFTLDIRPAAVIISLCSTPVGVMDRFTVALVDRHHRVPVLNACRRHGSFHFLVRNFPLPILSAQRLSASWIVSPIHHSSVMMLPMCAQRLSASWIVSQAIQLREGRQFVRAQRLSASWIVSPGRAATPRKPQWGAQRLSASWIVSHKPRRPDIFCCLVLNACRRHGSFHRPILLTCGDVSGAQRLSASWIVSHLQRDHRHAAHQVLNACRRHGSFHHATLVDDSTKVRCSTPVGVMDRFTPRRRVPHPTHVCAQRLSASWIVSRVCAWRDNFTGYVCSTPVGVMDRFTLGVNVGACVVTACSTPVGVMDRFTACDSSCCRW